MVLAYAVCCSVVAHRASAAGPRLEWNASAGNILKQRPAFYGSDEARRIAETVLLTQRNTGGWPKNRDMIRRLTEAEGARLRADKGRADSILDNGATHTHVRFLARVHNATKDARCRDACLKGVDFILRAQYANGGWPQAFPNPRGYHAHITFNDGAMVGAISVMRDIAERKADFALVDAARRAKAADAAKRGLECILKCQIIVRGRPTAWCAQHDEKTLAPRPARIYEKVSISGGESVGVVRYLMGIDKPSPRVVAAVEGAVAWFQRAKITGIRQVIKDAPSLPRGIDKVVVEDSKARPIWARFYEIGTNKPIFCGRDGKIKSTLAEIEPERRTGYSWYGYYATSLLQRDYPAWRKKLVPRTSHTSLDGFSRPRDDGGMARLARLVATGCSHHLPSPRLRRAGMTVIPKLPLPGYAP